MWFCYRVDKEDEIECLIYGCNFLLKNIPDEAFIYLRHGNPDYKFQGVDQDVFPYLLVNIGSGVSLVKVCYLVLAGWKTCLYPKISMDTLCIIKIVLSLHLLCPLLLILASFLLLFSPGLCLKVSRSDSSGCPITCGYVAWSQKENHHDGDSLFLQVESDTKFERIGGTSTGGGTFWGLGCLLTQAKVSFETCWCVKVIP